MSDTKKLGGTPAGGSAIELTLNFESPPCKDLATPTAEQLRRRTTEFSRIPGSPFVNISRDEYFRREHQTQPPVVELTDDEITALYEVVMHARALRAPDRCLEEAARGVEKLMQFRRRRR
ncbi:hypothetical protein D3C87_1361160 [compost metagenome]